MSKQQTYISEVLDSNGKMIDFERWSYKRIETVIRKLKELYFSDDLMSEIAFREVREQGATVIIYSTETAPSEGIQVMELSLDELRKTEDLQCIK